MLSSLMVINKAGGLIFRRDFSKGAAVRHKDNDYLVLAGTFHSVHAIASQISPELRSSGIEMLEADSFNLYCFQTLTGIKFLATAPPNQTNVDVLLRKIYELYADYVLKNPFYIPEMPIHCEQFDVALQRLLKV